MTELYDTCTKEQGSKAGCGKRANCLIINDKPSCHCIQDLATGMPLAGNPYKACTWDISGTWQLYSFVDPKSGFYREIISPSTNEPFLIRFDRTDAILKTSYITGAIFVTTALTSFAAGMCSRVLLDTHDDTSIIFAQSEGFVDHSLKNMIIRSPMSDVSLTKLSDHGRKIFGSWIKSDGSKVQISRMRKPKNWPSSALTEIIRSGTSYWYNDEVAGSPLLRLSMALFKDVTLPQERMAFSTKYDFVQLGWYGALHFGSDRISIYSPADGTPIFSLLRIETLPPLNVKSLGISAAPNSQQNLEQGLRNDTGSDADSIPYPMP